MDFRDFKQMTQDGTTLMTVVREMKTLLREVPPELDNDTLNGIVGAVIAYTSLDLEEVAAMELTLQEYAAISPAMAELNQLVENRALGPYTQTLCILMYRMGQQHGTQRQSEPTPSA